MKKLLLPLWSILLLTTCQKISPDKVPEEITVAANKISSKINICHKDVKTGIWKTMSINQNAWAEHQAHGDVRLDDQDGDGYVPYNACGYGTQGDCDDNNAANHPGATEICGNNIDDNCNGQIDENCIPSITICDQVWMDKNLDVSTYRNGEPIPQVTDPTEWNTLTTGAWCYYNNDPANGTIYGKLYNWYAVSDTRGLSPAGWHVPTDAEWATLSNCLGGTSIAGGKLKEVGTTHWYGPNIATNDFNFTALPAGAFAKNSAGEWMFYAIRTYGYWWSSTMTSFPAGYANYVQLVFFDGNFYGPNYEPLKSGFSVRCLKD